MVGFDDPGPASGARAGPTTRRIAASSSTRSSTSSPSRPRCCASSVWPSSCPSGWRPTTCSPRWRGRRPTVGATTVVVTSDRDAFGLIDAHTRVLRIINGGVDASPMLTAERLVTLLGVRPEQYRDFAALRGDPSDNLPGVRGIGPKTGGPPAHGVRRRRRGLRRPGRGGRGAWPGGSGAGCRAPGARATWELNCQVMAMREDVAVDLSGTVGALPLVPSAVRATFGRWSCRGRRPPPCGCSRATCPCPSRPHPSSRTGTPRPAAAAPCPRCASARSSTSSRSSEHTIRSRVYRARRGGAARGLPVGQARGG